MTNSSVNNHFAIALAGEQAALRGEHMEALAHYRLAIRLALATGAPEVFSRHYLEATMESLELLGMLDCVEEYCERAIQHYREQPPEQAVAWLDLASVYQRQAVILLKSAEPERARAALELAVSTAARAPASLPLCDRLLDWLRRGLSISPERILAEQRRFRYFSVRLNSDGK
jgi:hypothetical protein